MKCPACGTDNPEQVEFCRKCGNRLPETLPRIEIGRNQRVTRRVAAITVVVATAIILGPMLVYIYFDPEYSWNESIRDSDGDGSADTADVFPDNPAEWVDSDSDGTGDNADLVDYGNAVVRISVDLYIGNTTEWDVFEILEYGSVLDPYFVIEVSLYEWYGTIWEEPMTSESFNNTEKIKDPFSVTIDIPENQREMAFRISVYDHDWDSNDEIAVFEHHFGHPFTKSFVREYTSILLVYSIVLDTE